MHSTSQYDELADVALVIIVLYSVAEGGTHLTVLDASPVYIVTASHTSLVLSDNECTGSNCARLNAPAFSASARLTSSVRQHTDFSTLALQIKQCSLECSIGQTLHEPSLMGIWAVNTL